MQRFAFYETGEYREWLETQTLKSRRQILDRLSKIEADGHFGNHKYLERDVWELKFNDGRRVYYGFIKKASKIFRQVAESQSG